MQFQPTIDLWADGVQERILSGDLKLQMGQWCICGKANDHRCRFVGVVGGRSLWVAHWEGKRGWSDSYRRLRESYTKRH